MTKRLLSVTLALLAFPLSLSSAGISVDAGLTPAQNRWIIRTQARYMQRLNDPTPMDRQMVTLAAPVVIAYGVMPSFTLMAREIFLRKTMSMDGSGSTDYGRSDILTMAKYKAFRRNTRHTSLGVAAVLGLELPVGSDGFGSETWDLIAGVNGSYRLDAFAADADVRYVWNGVGERNDKPGNKVSVNLALAYRFALGAGADIALAPVLETGFESISPDMVDGAKSTARSEQMAYLSPGAKLTVSSFVVEALLQIPVWQRQPQGALSRGIGGLVGIRVML